MNAKLEAGDTGNKFLVGASGDWIVIMHTPTRVLSKSEALNLAAWLRVLADPKGEYFEELVQRIMET